MVLSRRLVIVCLGMALCMNGYAATPDSGRPTPTPGAPGAPLAPPPVAPEDGLPGKDAAALDVSAPPAEDPDAARRIQIRAILIEHSEIAGADERERKPSRSKKEALARARQIESLSRQPGSEFEMLAKRYSDGKTAEMGGYIPPFLPEEVDPAIRKAVEALKPGQVSEPVDTPLGYYVILRQATIEDLPGSMRNPDQVNLRCILIAYAGAQGAAPAIQRTHAEAKELAVQLRARALDPLSNFDQLALRYSDDPSAARGGLLGELSRSRTNSEFAKILFRLKPGEISSVIESSLGFHIFKRED